MAKRVDLRESQDVSDQVSGRFGNKCGPCKKKNTVQAATMFCADCQQYQCDECTKVHEMFEVLSGHEIVKAEEAPSLKPLFDMKGLDICTDHSEPLKYYCIDEKKLCCTTCAIRHHRGCTEVNEILSEANKPSFSTSDVESAIHELTNTALDLAKLLEKTKEGTTGKLEAALDYIDAVKNTLFGKFDKLKVALTDQFKLMESKLFEVLNFHNETTKDISRELYEKQEYLCTVKTRGTPDQLFIATHIVDNQIMPYKTSLADQKASLYTINCTVDCSENLQQILMSNVHLAAFKIEKIPVDTTDPPMERTVQLKLINSKDLKQGKDESREPFYTGIDFLSDGRLVLVDNTNKFLVIMNQNLEKIGIHMFGYSPKDVCVVSEEEVAVTSSVAYLIEFLQISKINEMTLKRTVKTTAKYDSICLMNKTTFLVSTLDDKRPLRMITLTGEEKDFDNLQKKEYKLNASASTCMRNKDTAVLTDRYKHKVYLYDVEDKGATRYVVKHEDIKEPRGVCVGPNDCILVCSSETNSIVQVTPSGKVTASHSLDMSYPRTVCVSKDGKRLAVSNSAVGKGKLQLFLLDAF